MPFGGLAPLPLRLGGPPDTGWSPEQHARVCLDAAAPAQLLPLAVLVVDVTAGGVATVTRALSRAGTDPSILTASQSGFVLTVSMSTTFLPAGGSSARPWRPLWGTAAYTGGVGTVAATVTGYSLAFATVPPPFVACIEIYGDVTEVDPHDYGTDEDKTASLTEGDAPYAYWILEDLKRDKGAAFSSVGGSFVMMENLAIARQKAAVRRIIERHASNQTPTTAGQAIFRWARILGIPRGNDVEWKLRKSCAYRTMMRATGPSETKITSVMRQMLGSSFVGITYHVGTLAVPPAPTYWPAINDGPSQLNIGGGTWSSDRARLTMSLQHVLSISDTTVSRTANVDMRSFLDGALNGSSTFDWSFDTSDGFLLGTSRLGRNSL